MHGLVVKEEDLQPRGRGFESWLRILNGMQAKQAITLTKRINVAYQKKNI